MTEPSISISLKKEGSGPSLDIKNLDDSNTIKMTNLDKDIDIPEIKSLSDSSIGDVFLNAKNTKPKTPSKSESSSKPSVSFNTLDDINDIDTLDLEEQKPKSMFSNLFGSNKKIEEPKKNLPNTKHLV